MRISRVHLRVRVDGQRQINNSANMHRVSRSEVKPSDATASANPLASILLPPASWRQNLGSGSRSAFVQGHPTPKPRGAPDYPDSDLQLRGLRRPLQRAMLRRARARLRQCFRTPCRIASEPTSYAVGFGSGSCPEFQPSQMMILAAADAVAVIIYLAWVWISNGCAVRRRVQRRTRTGTRTRHRPGQQGTARRAAGYEEAAQESRRQAPRMAGTSQRRRGGCLPVPVWVHRERVLRRTGSAGNADMP